jgi:CRISPR-associated endoribonuclease Cas6
VRLRIVLDNPQTTTIPINYQDNLTGLIYRLLGTSDADFSRFLHDEGYAFDNGPKRFKLFCFSWLQGRRAAIRGDMIQFLPGPIEWVVASPVDDFLRHCATGLLASSRLRVGTADFAIAEIQTLPTPTLEETAYFTCLSPIVASIPAPDGRSTAYYLRPHEMEAFSNAVRNNLLRKHHVLYGHPPADDQFAMQFKPDYLARSEKAGVKKISYKGIDVVGAFAPFRVTGSTELMRVMVECGAGEKNAGGFGCVEVMG